MTRRAGAAGDRRIRAAARVAGVREARRLAVDQSPTWAIAVALMYAAVALAWMVLACTERHWMGAGLPLSIAVYAAALAAGAWRLRAGRDRDPRSFLPLSGAFAHALVSVGGAAAIPFWQHGRGYGLETLFLLLGLAGIAFGTVPILFTAASTRRGTWLVAASLLGPLLLWLAATGTLGFVGF